VTYTDHDKFLSADFQYDDGKALVLAETLKKVHAGDAIPRA